MDGAIVQVLTICGITIGGCLLLFVGVLLTMVFTGRWLAIPTLFAIVPQTFRMIFGRGGLLRGTGHKNLQSRYNTDSDGEFQRSRDGRRMSASERIRAKRDRFESDRPLRPDRDDAPQIEPRPASPSFDDSALKPDASTWQQGGQRGPMKDRFRGDEAQMPPLNLPKGDGIGNRPRRDTRKSEWHEDEIFGGMGGDGDG